MGYESKLYIVDKFNQPPMTDIEQKSYASLIAMFDMGKFYALSDYFRNAPETDCYIYAADGNTQILEDRYGDALTELPIETVINIMEELQEKEAYYRRVRPCLSTLKALQEEQESWRQLAVMHFGY